MSAIRHAEGVLRDIGLVSCTRDLNNMRSLVACPVLRARNSMPIRVERRLKVARSFLEVSIKVRGTRSLVGSLRRTFRWGRWG